MRSETEKRTEPALEFRPGTVGRSARSAWPPLFLVLFFLTAVATACQTTVARQQNDHQQSHYQQTDPLLNGYPLLLISFDGLMTDDVARNETPNFDRIIERGVLAESMQPVFPTKTFPTHHSMATGLYVENHGVISNRFYDRDLQAWFSYGPPTNQPSGDLWWGGEPIWVTAERQGKTAATMFWPGSDAEIGGVRPTRYMPYDGGVPARTRVDSVVAWLDRNGPVRADFATLYFSEIDNAGHEAGPSSPVVDRAVIEMDTVMGYLLDRLDETGLGEMVNLLIVSDHGMVRLDDEKVILIDEIINMDDVEVIDRNPVAMIRPAEGKRDEVYRQLKDGERGYSVYLREELPERYHFSTHPRIPEIIMIAESPYTIITRELFEQNGIPEGMHGYDNRIPEMQAFFLAAGPSFRNDVQTGRVDAIDLYELMCSLIGVSPALNDGVPNAFAPLLR